MCYFKLNNLIFNLLSFHFNFVENKYYAMTMVILKFTNVEFSFLFIDLALRREIVYSISAVSIMFYKYAKDLGYP